jgi:pyrroline-5-carboxylate reductase
MLHELSGQLSHDLFATKSFISIAAGITIDDIEACIPNAKSVIRVMPNTPCLVGQSAAAYACGSKSGEDDKKSCEAIFNSVGTISEVPEKLMDAVTGLSGSGPACMHLLLNKYTARFSLISYLYCRCIYAY